MGLREWCHKHSLQWRSFNTNEASPPPFTLFTPTRSHNHPPHQLAVGMGYAYSKEAAPLMSHLLDGCPLILYSPNVYLDVCMHVEAFQDYNGLWIVHNPPLLAPYYITVQLPVNHIIYTTDYATLQYRNCTTEQRKVLTPARMRIIHHCRALSMAGELAIRNSCSARRHNRHHNSVRWECYNAPVVPMGLLAHEWCTNQRLQDYTSRTHQKG